MNFAGNIHGSGVNTLRIEVAKILLRLHIKNGYLCNVKHENEEQIRLCLAIEGDEFSHSEKLEIVLEFSSLTSMDIVFIESRHTELVRKILESCTPVLIKGNSLFECPIVVERGSNSDMPVEWSAAVIFLYVAADSSDKAFEDAANALRNDGFHAKFLVERKVFLIHQDDWESDYLHGKWSEFNENIPMQEEIDAMIAAGGYYKGPMLRWESS